MYKIEALIATGQLRYSGFYLLLNQKNTETLQCQHFLENQQDCK